MSLLGHLSSIHPSIHPTVESVHSVMWQTVQWCIETGLRNQEPHHLLKWACHSHCHMPCRRLAESELAKVFTVYVLVPVHLSSTDGQTQQWHHCVGHLQCRQASYLIVVAVQMTTDICESDYGPDSSHITKLNKCTTSCDTSQPLDAVITFSHLMPASSTTLGHSVHRLLTWSF